MQAAKEDLTYPRYAWIIYSWYAENWWTKDVAGTVIDMSCSDDELTNFLEKARPILIQQLPVADDENAPAIGGIVGSDCRLYAQQQYTETHSWFSQK